MTLSKDQTSYFDGVQSYCMLLKDLLKGPIRS